MGRMIIYYNIVLYKARFRRSSAHVPNPTDELSTPKPLVWCGKSVTEFDRVCRTFVELNLGLTHGAPSKSDVAPVSLQSQHEKYGVRTRPKLSAPGVA